MHEFGIAREMVWKVDRSVRARSGTRASRIVVRMNPGVLDEESLRAAFDAVKGETTAAGAELVVERVPSEGYCLDCTSRVEVDDPAGFSCPKCGSARWVPVGDPTVSLASVEIEV